jgi:hypothetical protein
VSSAANVASCWWQTFQSARSWKNTRRRIRSRDRQQLAERIELLLHANGRALLLLEAIPQQMKFVLQIA